MTENKTCLTVGESAEFTRHISAQDIATFAQISGDDDPVHTDEEYAKTTPFGRIIAHGVLALSPASAVAAVISKRAMDRGAVGRPVSIGYDRIRFTRPVFAGNTLTAKYTIEEIDDVAGRSRSKVEITNENGELCVIATHIMVWALAK